MVRRAISGPPFAFQFPLFPFPAATASPGMPWGVNISRFDRLLTGLLRLDELSLCIYLALSSAI